MTQETLGRNVSVADGVMSAGAPGLSSATANFNAAMVGYAVTVTNTVAGTTGTDGIITIAQKVLTSVSAPFTAGMVGRWILVVGAGAAGGNLLTTIAIFTNSASVTLTDAALTSVVGNNFTIYDGTLATTIAAYVSPTQVTLAANATVAVTGATVTLAWAGSVDFDTSRYPQVMFSSNLSGGDTVTVKIVLPDSMTAPVASDINGVRTGLSGTNKARIYYGGPTYRLTKVGTGSQASLYADLGSRES